MESLLSWPTEDAAEYTRTDIVRWWEARRLHFNVYVGVVGIIAWFLVLIAGSAAVKPAEDFEEPLAMIVGPVIYVMVANACYTLGWIADVVSSQSRPRVGLYKAGVIFSVVITALPGVCAVVAWLITLITRHKLD
jgi:hypothetical protein